MLVANTADGVTFLDKSTADYPEMFDDLLDSAAIEAKALFASWSRAARASGRTIGAAAFPAPVSEGGSSGSSSAVTTALLRLAPVSLPAPP
jgi:hypothetical protein